MESPAGPSQRGVATVEAVNYDRAMPHEGQEIVNPQTGQRMQFVAISSEELRVESIHPPTDAREPEHIHPHQQSGGEVTSGSLMFEVDGKPRRVAAGESIAIPAHTPHRFWNESGQEARSVQFFRPALEIAGFFETYFELARRGELSDDGSIPLLRVAAVAPRFGKEIRLTRPPWAVVRAVSAALGPISRIRGVQGQLEYGPSHQ